jgi:glycosyltransferase involved in cell wall biosynthesis
VRIAIDARKLRDYGIGTYIRNLLRHLARLDRETEYVVFCYEADRALAAELGDNFRPVPILARPYSLAEQVAIPFHLARLGIGLFHAPHYTLPPLAPCPAVVTIHDCIHLAFPQYLPGRLARLYARLALRLAARRARRILTVSEASRRDILRLLGPPPERVVVVPNAIDEQFWTPPAPQEVARVAERYQLADPFVLYAGNIKPHKNLERLIAAFARLRRGGFERVKLLIIGDEISKYPALRRAVHRHQLHPVVRFLGFVPDRTLAVLYRLADLFVFPSLYEGFGLPPLEAMASGTPVVTSNVSSLPEVVGDAAVLVDPYDPDAIAEGMRRVLSDPDLRAELRAKGLARAREFSWDRSVERIRQIYAEAAKG